MIVNLLGYIATAAILGTYAWLVGFEPSPKLRPFHLANALGALPIAVGEVLGRAYPALILTASFGVIGWLGLYQTGRKRGLDRHETIEGSEVSTPREGTWTREQGAI